MSGLLDLLQTPAGQGLLNAGFAYLRAPGNTWSRIGQAGQAGLFGAQAYATNQGRQELDKLQMEQMRLQQEQQQRQQAMQEQQAAAIKSAWNPGGPMVQDPSAKGYQNSFDTGGQVPQQAPSFDIAKYATALAQAGNPGALQAWQAMQKETPAPVISKPGDVARDPRTGALLWQNPAEAAKPDKPPSAVQEYQFAVSQGEKRTFAEWIRDNAKASASSVTVGYGAPVAGVDQATGQPVYFQPSKDGGKPSIVQGVAPQPPAIPATTREKLADNSIALAKINAALSLVTSNGDSLGAKNYVPDALMQRLDPSGVDVRAAIADIGSQKIHDRSGSAVTLSEAPRLMPFVPQVTDTPEAARKKLERLGKEYTAMQQELASGASIKQATDRRAGVPSQDDPLGLRK